MNGWGKKSGVEQVVVGSGSVMQLSCPYATRTSHSPSTDGRLSVSRGIIILGNLLRGS